jgi:putative PEP-CTERM system TPR-repeat lipoprotein
MLDLLGRAYALAGKPELAMQSMQRAAALAPDNADILTRLASIRIGMGDMARAAGDLEHALELSPNQAGAAEQLVVAAISAGEVDKASLALERLRKQEGESETVGNLAALIRMAQLDLDGAGGLLSDVIKRFPDAIQPRINLAKVLVLRDKAADAQTVLAEVLKRKPAEPTALNNIVGLMLADNKAAQAQALLEAAHAAAPKDPDVTIQLANLYLRLRDTPKGLALLELVLKDQPENEPLVVAKARLQATIGQSEAARTTYRQALELNPADIEARQALAGLLVAVKDGDAARAVLNDGLKASPGDAALLQAYVGVVLQTDGLDAALAAAEKLARDQKNLPQARTLRGDIYMGSGRYSDAAAAYATELRADPSDTLVVRMVGALNASGRSEQATQMLRDALNNTPNDLVLASALAGMDITARRFFDAETHLEVVLAQHPGDADALNNLAWVYQQRADARARATAQKAYLLDPSPQAADTLGWILTTQGNAATGLALLRQASAQIGRDPTVQYHLAVALRDTARREEAIRVLRPIVQGLVDFEERPAATKLLQELQQG